MEYANGEIVSLDSGKLLIRSDVDSPALRKLVGDPERILDSAEIMKDSRTTKAGIAKLADDSPLGETEVFVKRFNSKGLWYSFRYLFREPRPFRVWRAAMALRKADVPTPAPIAAVTTKDGIMPGAAYLIRESVPNAVGTLELFERLLSDDSARAEYVDSVCDLFARTHNAGIFHGDAKCSNVYASSDLSRGALECSLGLWDLLSCHVGFEPLPSQLREKEIARLAGSFADIERRLGRDSDPSEAFDIFWSVYVEKTVLEKPFAS